MTKATEEQPVAVPARAKRAGETLRLMVLGRTDGLDRADVDGPRTGGQRRQVVQPDRQGPPGTDPGRGVLSSRGEPRSRRGGPCDGHDVRGPPGENLKRLSEATAERARTARSRSAGTTSPNRGVRRSGRWGFRRCATGWSRRQCGWYWNRSSSANSPSTATAFAPAGAAKTHCASGRAAQGGLHVHRRCRPEELLRHDPARPPDGPGGSEGVGRAGAEPDRGVPQARRPGRLAGVDARDGQPPGGGDQPAAQQHLSEPAGPSDGPSKGSRWCVTRTIS